MSAALTDPTATARGGKFLTFSLENGTYGIPIRRVREIFGYTHVTAIPRMPSHVKGVINLRGQVISVVDLRNYFCFEPAAASSETCIIVIESTRNGVPTSTGLIVDSVSEVLHIGDDHIEDAPEVGSPVDSRLLMGLGKSGSRIIVLLDIDRVLHSQDL
jgi:purine-binding chemotaxis protein CheW